MPASERRRSGRAHKVSVYTERDDEEDEQEMLEGVAEWDYGGDSSEANSGDEDSVLSDVPSEEQEASGAEEAEDEPLGGDDAEASAEEAEEESEEEPEPPKSTKRGKAVASKSKSTAAAKPPVKSSVLAQLQSPARSTRLRRGAKDASDMDVDTDE